jgi:hypothetical protein
MTYIQIIEQLAKAPDMRSKWHELVPEDKREGAAKLLKDFMYEHFTTRLMGHRVFDMSGLDRRMYVNTRKYCKGIPIEKAKELHDFFFTPTKVVKTYSYN